MGDGLDGGCAGRPSVVAVGAAAFAAPHPAKVNVKVNGAGPLPAGAGGRAWPGAGDHRTAAATPALVGVAVAHRHPLPSVVWPGAQYAGSLLPAPLDLRRS